MKRSFGPFTFIKLIFVLLLLGAHSAFAEERSPAEDEGQLFLLDGKETWRYYKPDYLGVITKIPDTSWKAIKMSFSKEALVPWAVILSTTALTYHYDEEILLEVQRWGRDLGIGNGDNTRTYVRFLDIPIFRGPSDLGSTLYYIGDGWTHTFIALGFFSYGKLNENNRALQTSLQMVHGMIVSTIFSQTFKRATGRQSPIRRTSKRGDWRPFPSIAEYGRNTAAYDAFPSGHIMTATLTLTIINENYPEYSHWVLPIGWTLVGLLGLQMVNNAVHWASDYPLGIAMGIVFGKLAAANGREKVGESTSWWKNPNLDILPMIEPETMGVQAIYRF